MAQAPSSGVASERELRGTNLPFRGDAMIWDVPVPGGAPLW